LRAETTAMLEGLRNLFSSQGVPYADPNALIPLGAVLKHDWFELWYQPKIELRSLHLVGAEALVRARHPTRGIVPPALLLPGASEEDLHALTERVILTALGDWETFAQYGVSIKLAVNVPVSALVELPMTQMLREARPNAANWPGLTLEVTEDQILPDLDLARDVAEALRELKCDLAVDDFGAGYSSLVRLKQLPFSELKIDRSYVANCNEDQFNAGLCETIVELGRRFGLRTVAEGIETSHESHKLQSIGCQIGQGYLFAAPMPKWHLVDNLRTRMKGLSSNSMLAAS
jgi:EAL domain-containing protein (putative c-di-GMP-specific phosphodiesterase class I)